MTFARIFPIAEESLDTLDELLGGMWKAVWPLVVDVAKAAGSFERGVALILPEHTATALALLRADDHKRNVGKSLTLSVQEDDVASLTSH